MRVLRPAALRTDVHVLADRRPSPDATSLLSDYARVWRDMPKVVFSRTLETVDWNSRLERGDPVEMVRKVKAETDGTLEVAGATLAAPIVLAGLVDEFRMVMAPIVVGGGTRFFPTVPSWISLRLSEKPHFSRWHGPAAIRGETRLMAGLVRAIRRRPGSNPPGELNVILTQWASDFVGAAIEFDHTVAPPWRWYRTASAES